MIYYVWGPERVLLFGTGDLPYNPHGLRAHGAIVTPEWNERKGISAKKMRKDRPTVAALVCSVLVRAYRG